MKPMNLSTEDRRLLGLIIQWRITHLEGQLEKFERRQIHSHDDGRQGRINGTVTELGKLFDLLDRLEGDAE